MSKSISAIDTEKINLRNQVANSAYFDLRNTVPELFRLLGYRQHVAQQLLHENNEENRISLEEMMKYVNDNIKTLLNL